MNMCPSRKIPPESWLKGQVFFLWSNDQNIQLAKEKIPLLGGRVDAFLSRDITTVLIDDYHLATYQYLFPNFSIDRGYFDSSSLVTTSTNYPRDLFNLPSTSQGIALNSANYPHRIICFALQFGIVVCGIAHFFSSIDSQLRAVRQPKKRRNQNLTYLTGTFVKFEGVDKKFKPCYKIFGNDVERLMPLRNASVLVKVNNCADILNSSIVPKQVLHQHQTNITDKIVKPLHEFKPPLKPGDKKTINKIKPKEENNYCECCRTHYDELKPHLRSANHLKFVTNDKNYETVSDIVKYFPNTQEFLSKHQHTSTSNSENDIHCLQYNSETVTSVLNSCSTMNNNHILPNMNVEDMPLDLHVETLDDTEVSNNLTIHPGLLDHQSKIGNIAKDLLNVQCDPGFDLSKVKSEPLEEMSPYEGYVNDNSTACPNVLDGLPNQTVPADVSKTDALAQMFLKNFDSYWLDSLPDEDKDLYFDENIFDLDDDQQRLEEPNEINVDDSSQSPGIASCVSSLPLQSSVNISMLMNSAGEVRDIVGKSGQSDLDISINKVDSIKPITPVTHPLTIEKLLSQEKPLFENLKLKADTDISNTISPDPHKVIPNLDASIAVDALKNVPLAKSSKALDLNDYRMTSNPNPLASCSILATEKSAADKLFSDDSEDEVESNQKIGDTFICNVLDIITSSEGEAKVNELNLNEPASSDSGLKMDSKPVSNEINSEPEKEIANVTKNIVTIDNFTSVIKSNIDLEKTKICPKKDPLFNKITDTALFPKHAEIISNRLSSSTDENSRDAENAYDSGFNNESNDFDAKSIEKFSGGQNPSSLSVQALTCQVNMGVNKTFAGVLNPCETKSVSSYKTEDDILTSDVKCSTEMQAFKNENNIHNFISKPLTNPSDFKALGNTVVQDSLNHLEASPQLRNFKAFNNYEVNLQPNISQVSIHHQMLQPPHVLTNCKGNDFETFPKDKYNSLIPESHDNFVDGLYDKFKRSSHHSATSKIQLDLNKELNISNKPETHIPVLCQNIDHTLKPFEELDSSTPLVLDNQYNKEILGSNLNVIKNCESSSGVSSINQSFTLSERSFYTSCQKVTSDYNSNNISLSSNNPTVSEIQVTSKSANRDHAVHIPKKRYFSTISRELELQSQQSSVIQYGLVKNQNCEILPKNDIMNPCSSQNVTSFQGEKSEPKHLSSPATRNSAKTDSNKVEKPASSKKNTKSVKRKRREVTRRRIRRKCEDKHSTINTIPEVNTSETKPKMNLYTSYRLSQSKTLPNVRMPPKKSLPKLKKLPSLWRVTKVRGSGIKLRFTCIQPESFRAIVSCDEYEFNE